MFSDQAGSGCHLHFSLWQEGKNLIPDLAQPEKLSAIAQQFLAGVLKHLPGLMAITTPIVNSYRRLQPHCWSGAFTAWGFDNREAAIRVPSNFTLPSPTHIELKTVDATAYPYLSLRAMIFAGLDGIAQKLPLPEPVTVDPGLLSSDAQAAAHIQPLPNFLGAAITALENDSVLTDALGKTLAQAFIEVHKAEWQVLQGKTLEEEVALLLSKY